MGGGAGGMLLTGLRFAADTPVAECRVTVFAALDAKSWWASVGFSFAACWTAVFAAVDAGSALAPVGLSLAACCKIAA